MKRLGLSFGLVVLVWGGLQFHHSGPGDALDTVILLFIGTIYVLATLVMLVFRDQWTARAMGLLLTVFGTAVLYSEIGWSRVVDAIQPAPEWLTDWVRACLLVGGCLLGWGLIWWVSARLHPPDSPEWDDE